MSWSDHITFCKQEKGLSTKQLTLCKLHFVFVSYSVEKYTREPGGKVYKVIAKNIVKICLNNERQEKFECPFSVSIILIRAEPTIKTQLPSKSLRYILSRFLKVKFSPKTVFYFIISIFILISHMLFNVYSLTDNVICNTAFVMSC